MIVLSMHEYFIMQIWKFIPLEKSGDVLGKRVFLRAEGGGGAINLYIFLNHAIKVYNKTQNKFLYFLNFKKVETSGMIDFSC